MTPLIFLSGLMFPVAAMPGWIAWLTLADPLTYAVDAMRRTIDRYEPAAWGGLRPASLAELGAVAAFSLVALAIAARRFARQP